MDSHSSTSFIPLSLTDTLIKKDRTLHSKNRMSIGGGGINNASKRATANARGSLSGLNQGSLPPSSRKEEQAREKDLMCLKLGIKNHSSLEEQEEQEEQAEEQEKLNQHDPTMAPRTHSDHQQQQEIDQLNQQIQRLNQHNQKLITQVESLQLQLKQAASSTKTRQGSNSNSGTRSVGLSSDSPTNGTTCDQTSGIGRNEMEMLEKSFAQQEILLAGYQRDAEKSFLTIEHMKKQARKYTEILQRTFGPNYEQDLGLVDPTSSSSSNSVTPLVPIQAGHSTPTPVVPCTGPSTTMTTTKVSQSIAINKLISQVAMNSPIVRQHQQNQNGPVPGTPCRSLQNTISNGEIESSSSPPTPGGNDSIYLESLSILLRSIEQKILKRDYELEATLQMAQTKHQQLDKDVQELDRKVRSIGVGKENQAIR